MDKEELKFDKHFEIITGDELLDISEEEQVPIIEGVAYPGNIILVVAPQKHCKTLLAQHMSCEISQGKPFLSTFDVPNENIVLYLATEGNKTDNKDRLIRMEKAIGLNKGNVIYAPCFFKFNAENTQKQLNQILMDIMPNLPSVIIIDSLYSSIRGRLTQDDVVSEFMDNIRLLCRNIEYVKGLRPAVIILHHLKKSQRDKDGKKIEQDGSDLYGSYVLGASVDHIFLLEKHSAEHKHYMFKCVDERSGNIIESVRIKLNEPDPLYFSLVSTHYEQVTDLLKLLELNPDGISKIDIIRKLRISKSLYYIIRKEIENRIITETVDRQAVIKLKKNIDNIQLLGE